MVDDDDLDEADRQKRNFARSFNSGVLFNIVRMEVRYLVRTRLDRGEDVFASDFASKVARDAQVAVLHWFEDVPAELSESIAKLTAKFSNGLTEAARDESRAPKK